jgi:hypothetical protein
MARKPTPSLRRYTSLPVVIDMLMNERITLVSPSAWVDANDRKAMAVYQEHLGHGFVGAVCLTEAPETFHHWQVFAGGSAGMCVHFDKERFCAMFDGRANCLIGPVDYVRIADIATIDASDIHRLPFMKRAGFRDEAEFRAIAVGGDEDEVIHIPLDRAAVSRITFSPTIPPALVDTTRRLLHQLPGWEKLRIVQSRLTDSVSWQRALEKYPARHAGGTGRAKNKSS